MVIPIINLLLGALEPWNFMTFPSYWECHHPNWRTHIFQRGRYTTNQWLLMSDAKKNDPDHCKRYERVIHGFLIGWSMFAPTCCIGKLWWVYPYDHLTLGATLWMVMIQHDTAWADFFAIIDDEICANLTFCTFRSIYLAMMRLGKHSTFFGYGNMCSIYWCKSVLECVQFLFGSKDFEDRGARPGAPKLTHIIWSTKVILCGI